MKTRDMARVSLILVTIIIFFWFFSHFHIIIDTLDTEKVMYDCPGVGLKEKICTTFGGCYIGCTKIDVETRNPLKKAIAIYWD